MSGSAAAPLRRQLRLAGRDRVVELRAALAPPPAKPGTVLVWLFDISDADADRAKLARRLQQTEGALDALTHLIESAPFPMWYRGPGPQPRPGQRRVRCRGRRAATRPR